MPCRARIGQSPALGQSRGRLEKSHVETLSFAGWPGPRFGRGGYGRRAAAIVAVVVLGGCSGSSRAEWVDGDWRHLDVDLHLDRCANYHSGGLGTSAHSFDSHRRRLAGQPADASRLHPARPRDQARFGGPVGSATPDLPVLPVAGRLDTRFLALTVEPRVSFNDATADVNTLETITGLGQQAIIANNRYLYFTEAGTTYWLPGNRWATSRR